MGREMTGWNESSSSVLPTRISCLLDEGKPCLVISPHLDDAVLSCGSLLAALARRCTTTVASVFTEAHDGPHTRAARSFHRACQAKSAMSLFARRASEDIEVLTDLGAAPRHLGWTDALYRRRGRRVQGGRLLPEFVHRYPTYRFDIACGRIARADRRLPKEIAEVVSGLAAEVGASTIFFPLGVGRHVDHLITRAAGAEFTKHAVFYADFPYSLTADIDEEFIRRHGLERWEWTADVEEKRRSIRGYRTQVPAMFPDGRIPIGPETYFVQPDGTAPTPRPPRPGR